MDTPFFPSIGVNCLTKAVPVPLEKRLAAEVVAAGGGEDDLRALTFAEVGKPRERLHRFILHFRRHGAAVLTAWEYFADEAVKNGHPERLGSETLSANARYFFRSARCSNNERPGYLVALRIKRPDLAGMLDAVAGWPLALLLAGWNPWRKESGQ